MSYILLRATPSPTLSYGVRVPGGYEPGRARARQPGSEVGFRWCALVPAVVICPTFAESTGGWNPGPASRLPTHWWTFSNRANQRDRRMAGPRGSLGRQADRGRRSAHGGMAGRRVRGPASRAGSPVLQTGGHNISARHPQRWCIAPDVAGPCVLGHHVDYRRRSRLVRPSCSSVVQHETGPYGSYAGSAGCARRAPGVGSRYRHRLQRGVVVPPAWGGSGVLDRPSTQTGGCGAGQARHNRLPARAPGRGRKRRPA